MENKKSAINLFCSSKALCWDIWYLRLEYSFNSGIFVVCSSRLRVDWAALSIRNSSLCTIMFGYIITSSEFTQLYVINFNTLHNSISCTTVCQQTSHHTLEIFFICTNLCDASAQPVRIFYLFLSALLISGNVLSVSPLLQFGMNYLPLSGSKHIGHL